MQTGTATWLKSTVGIEPVSGVNANGEDTYGASADHACFIQYKRQMVLTGNGIEKLSQAMLTVDGSDTSSVGDRVTFADGTKAFILSIQTSYGPSGSAYVKVLYT